MIIITVLHGLIFYNQTTFDAGLSLIFLYKEIYNFSLCVIDYVDSESEVKFSITTQFHNIQIFTEYDCNHQRLV